MTAMRVRRGTLAIAPDGTETRDIVRRILEWMRRILIRHNVAYVFTAAVCAFHSFANQFDHIARVTCASVASGY